MKPKSVPQRGFSTTEYETRLNRAQKLMAEQGFSALWLTTEPEIRYFSGFLTQFWQSPTRPWFMVVPLNGKPVAIIPEIGATTMASTWIDEIYTWPSPVPEDDGVSLLQSLLRRIAGPSGKIGVPMGPETHTRMPLRDFFKIYRSFSNEIDDASAIIRTLRSLKSEAEIEKIAAVCDIVSGAFSALHQLIPTGTTEREVFVQFKMEILRQGADDVPYLVGGAGRDGYGEIISPPSDRTLQQGDILMLDTGSVFDGYFCDFDRNYAIGKPSGLAQQAYEILLQATQVGLKAARPGVTASSVFHSMRRTLEKWRPVSRTAGRMGHGLGMQITEWPSISPTDQTVLQQGMILTLEPSVELEPGRMMVHEEDIVINEAGADLLTQRAPMEMPVII